MLACADPSCLQGVYHPPRYLDVQSWNDDYIQGNFSRGLPSYRLPRSHAEASRSSLCLPVHKPFTQGVDHPPRYLDFQSWTDDYIQGRAPLARALRLLLCLVHTLKPLTHTGACLCTSCHTGSLSPTEVSGRPVLDRRLHPGRGASRAGSMVNCFVSFTFGSYVNAEASHSSLCLPAHILSHRESIIHRGIWTSSPGPTTTSRATSRAGSMGTAGTGWSLARAGAAVGTATATLPRGPRSRGRGTGTCWRPIRIGRILWTISWQ